MFVDMLKVLANSKSIEHRIIGQGIYYAFTNVDGAFMMVLRAMSSRQLLALVSTLKRAKYGTPYDVKNAVRAMRDQFIPE